MDENVTDDVEESAARWLGAVLLERHIRATHRTVPAFCEATGLERTYVSRLIDGDRGDRMPVTMASKIEEATGGAVPMAAWARRARPSDDLAAANATPAPADVAERPTVAA
jgi:hypothetical protein